MRSPSFPARLRAVVVLRDIYDLSHAEIADELGISESAAKVRLHRARRRLRTQVFPLAGETSRLDPEEHAHAV
ncbi:sigma factor-like helix-turn-helix DNA-binding protein [Aquihabitans daechungensis]|uniref:sigma-70 region 4 domain-containing protein n=1 Tax=Aquihabitans daechungensis TaxID=1052257 RepID=UPI003BA373AD